MYLPDDLPLISWLYWMAYLLSTGLVTFSNIIRDITVGSFVTLAMTLVFFLLLPLIDLIEMLELWRARGTNEKFCSLNEILSALTRLVLVLVVLYT